MIVATPPSVDGEATALLLKRELGPLGVTVPGTRTYEANGDSAQLFVGNLDPFEIPASGGSVHVRGTRGGIAGTHTSDGTATASR